MNAKLALAVTLGVGVIAYSLVTLTQQSKQIRELEALVRGDENGGTQSYAAPPKESLAERVAFLETQVAYLRARSRGARALAPGVGPEPSLGADGTPLSGRDADEDEAAEDFLAALESNDPTVRERFRAVLEEEERARREQRRQERTERWKQESIERVTKLAETADLASHQVTFLNDRLQLERDLIHETFQSARDGSLPGGRREARAKIDTFRLETDKEVAEVLDEGQYTAYEAMRLEESNGWRGGGGRGGGRGGR